MKKMSTKSFSSFLSIPIGSVGVSISNVISWFSKNPFLGSTALVATSGILAYGIITFDLGKLAMSEDQLALGGSSPIVSHNGIIVERISDINKASETLSSLYKDPMMIACASEDLANNHLGRKKSSKMGSNHLSLSIKACTEWISLSSNKRFNSCCCLVATFC
jgi:hypothetical protein